MNTKRDVDPRFPYGRDQVKMLLGCEDPLYVIMIFIEDQLVNRKLFFSQEEASNHMYNLELAISLGATFNEQGYWDFEFTPDIRKKQFERYYRLARG